MEIIRVPIGELTPDPDNAKDHPKWQIEQIKNSIEQFGNLDPIGIWGDDNLIVEGHGRFIALQELGYNEAECIRLDWLSEDERRAYGLAHNKLTMNSGFIPEALDFNLAAIGQIDMSLFGFKVGDWFRDHQRGDESRQDGNEEYNAFLDKFEEPKTTDDCYTPDNVYEVVADYVASYYGLDRDKFIRPFYPGGDYQSENYSGRVVVDNPPFSIESEIVKYYSEHKIPFFLFCSGLVAMGNCNKEGVTAVCTGCGIRYENGAVVDTGFVTNMEPDIIARTAPDLRQDIEAANRENLEAVRTELPKYDYPDEVVLATKLNQLSKYGQDLKIRRESAYYIRALDAQKETGKTLYGAGLLISRAAAAEKAAAEKAAAEKAAATRWPLSDREVQIIESLGGDSHDEG